MTDRVLQHLRTHNLLLLRKHFSLREGSSPFTLVIDTVEQSAKPLIKRYIHDAKASKVSVIFVSFETIISPLEGVTIVRARQKNPSELVKEIAQATATFSVKHNLVIIDTLHPLLTYPHLNIATFLSSILQAPLPPAAPPPPPPSSARQTPSISPLSPPQTQPSLLAIYHADIPLSPPSPSPFPFPSSTSTPPSPLALLSYLATTILTVHSPAHLYAKHRAAARSLPEPVYGLAEGREGVLIGLPPALSSVSGTTTNGNGNGNGVDNVGLESRNGRRGYSRGEGDVILEVEFRRKSGRGIREWFFVPAPHGGPKADRKDGDVMLLDDHPLFTSLTSPSLSTPPTSSASGDPAAAAGATQEPGGGWVATFDLTLTAKQRRDRAEVVLPYFDAQKIGGFGGDTGTGAHEGGESVEGIGGGGGRILYDLGVEDDFDEEEDEI